MKTEFLVVFEVDKKGVGAFAPDIPGCFAVGPTVDETRRRYLEAVESHLKWLAKDHDPIPQPATTTVDFSKSAGETTSRYYVEWLSIPMPAEKYQAISV
ncbi:MAG: type II toxin-antitoxin system HicB family antitoxin [Terracidiphilus sp.]|jgi:predicted RNase H-like HicB family nuclease